jgi:hypothetical protein
VCADCAYKFYASSDDEGVCVACGYEQVFLAPKCGNCQSFKEFPNLEEVFIKEFHVENFRENCTDFYYLYGFLEETVCT